MFIIIFVCSVGCFAMAVNSLRNKLRRFVVPALEKTGASLGVGAYGEVLEMRMNDTRVAAKRLHQQFVGTEGWKDALGKFEDECIRYIDIYFQVSYVDICIFMHGNVA